VRTQKRVQRTNILLARARCPTNIIGLTHQVRNVGAIHELPLRKIKAFTSFLRKSCIKLFNLFLHNSLACFPPNILRGLLGFPKPQPNLRLSLILGLKTVPSPNLNFPFSLVKYGCTIQIKVNRRLLRFSHSHLNALNLRVLWKTDSQFDWINSYLFINIGDISLNLSSHQVINFRYFTGKSAPSAEVRFMSSN
jgi:hypothetical protein